MTQISLEMIQKLRELTSAGMMDCKKALIEANGDLPKAVELLRKKGAAVAEKRSGNKTSEGIIHTYIHAGAKIGVMIEINCETDFVARTELLKQFAHDTCMHIAAYRPVYLSADLIDENLIAKEKAIIEESLAQEKKPDAIKKQMLEGRLKNFYAQVSLLDQPFIKNDKITVGEQLKDIIGKLGENIRINRFVRFEIGS